MGSTPIGAVTAAGFTRFDFPYCLDYQQVKYRGIYGSDINVEESTQDGQYLGLLAQGVFDVGGVAQSVFNSFSPTFAVGTGLDRLLPLNGIRRKRATYSTAPFRCLGQAGASAEDVLITDPAGFVWALPAGVRIPDAGEITVTATCQTKGAIPLAAGAIDTAKGLGSVANPLRGFQSVSNVAAAALGQPVETDSALRQRQARSTGLPSLSILDGLYGALLAINGVNRLKVYENDEGYPDAFGLPGHGIGAVIDGGDADTIARIIRLKKGGCGTYGSTYRLVTDASGIAKPIRFTYLAQAPVGFALVVQRLPGYTLSIENQVKASLAAWAGGLDIGETVERDQAFAAAKLYDGAGSKTYRIVQFLQGRVGRPLSTNDVAMGRFEAATCDAANVAITVLPQAA